MRSFGQSFANGSSCHVNRCGCQHFRREMHHQWRVITVVQKVPSGLSQLFRAFQNLNVIQQKLVRMNNLKNISQFFQDKLLSVDNRRLHFPVFLPTDIQSPQRFSFSSLMDSPKDITDISNSARILFYFTGEKHGSHCSTSNVMTNEGSAIIKTLKQNLCCGHVDLR